jgi:YHS domain-containing protein
MDVKDPVCGMDIEQDEAAGQSDFQGKTFYFCSNECKEKFDRSPQIYAKSAQKGAGARS